jgi:hypothetical protein
LDYLSTLLAPLERCRAAGIGDEVPFATKIDHFKWMLQRAIDARVPFAWVTADEAYGQVKHMRAGLEERHVAYVLATKVNDTVPTTGGTDAEVRDWSPPCPGRHGNGSPLVRARTASGSTTGPGSQSAQYGRTAAGTGSWPAAASATPPRSPTTSATAPSPPG